MRKSSFPKISVFLILLFSLHDFFAQGDDTLAIVNSKYDSLLTSDSESMNTLFYKHSDGVLINNLGPFGSPYYFPTANFLYSKSLFDATDILKNELLILQGIKPYTKLTYLNASRKEQLFSIKHIQQFGKLLFLNVDFNKISSPGAYRNQESNRTLFKGEIEYRTKKDNYAISFTNTIQRDFFEENGGLKNSNDFESKLLDDERSHEVNLLTSYSFLKRYKYQLNQRLNLFEMVDDSSSVSSFFLRHTVFYETGQRVFYDNDPESSIYPGIHLDSLTILSTLGIDSVVTEADSTGYNYLNDLANDNTIDSTYFNTLSNTIFAGMEYGDLELELFFQHERKKYLQGFSLDTIYRGLDTSYTNTFTGFAFQWQRGNFSIRSTNSYGLSGYRMGDIESETLIGYERRSFSLGARVQYYLNEPSLKRVNYNSNHFSWKNYGFDKQSIFSLGLELYLKKPKVVIVIETKNLNNPFYYDSVAQSAQLNGVASMFGFSISKDYRLMNFYFKTRLLYQSTTDENLLPLPQFIGRQVLFYQNKAFKKSLKYQLGIGVSYSTSFYGYSYMPALTEFYVQNHNVIGEYPNIDIFLNTHLRRAQIFLKYEHINAGGNLSKAYQVPSYPILNKSLKFGISWSLFD